MVIDIPEDYKRVMDNNVINEMHHLICAWCDNEKCVRGTDACEFEQWKAQAESEVHDEISD